MRLSPFPFPFLFRDGEWNQEEIEKLWFPAPCSQSKLILVFLECLCILFLARMLRFFIIRLVVVVVLDFHNSITSFHALFSLFFPSPRVMKIILQRLMVVLLLFLLKNQLLVFLLLSFSLSLFFFFPSFFFCPSNFHSYYCYCYYC